MNLFDEIDENLFRPLTGINKRDEITGVYQTPQEYYVRDEDVEAFDKDFPPKEKLKLPGQIF